MQKFTVFAIMSSVSMLLVISDLVFHDYLKADFSQNTVEDQSSSIPEGLYEFEGESPDLSEETLPLDTEPLDTAEIPDASESMEDLFLSAGFSEIILKESSYSGFIHQFLPYSPSEDVGVKAVNMFNGTNYLGSHLELKFTSDTDAFQAYLSIRDAARALTEIGTLNEVNNFGDSSFYFNHVEKSKTVHLVMRRGSYIHALSYSYSDHESMKNFLDLL